MSFYPITLKPKQWVKLPIEVSRYLTVKQCDKFLIADTDTGERLKLEKGDEYELDDFNRLEIQNPHNEVVELNFWASSTGKYSDSNASIHDTLKTKSLVGDTAENTQFDISLITSILPLNTGRKEALALNNSDSEIVYVKANDSNDIVAKGMPLLPKASMKITSSAEYFATVESGSADLRIYEESY